MMTPRGRTVLDELRVSQGLDPKLPWGGRSPRVLTRGYEFVRFESRDDDVTDFDESLIEEQYRRWGEPIS